MHTHTHVHACTCVHVKQRRIVFCTHTHTHTCIHARVRVHARARACTHTRVHVYTCVNVCVHVCARVHMHARTHLHTRTCVHVHVCVHTRVCMHACVSNKGGYSSAHVHGGVSTLHSATCTRTRTGGERDEHGERGRTVSRSTNHHGLPLDKCKSTCTNDEAFGLAGQIAPLAHSITNRATPGLAGP